MAGFDKCSFLFERWKNLALWRNLWTILLFVFGCAIVIFLVGAIFLFLTSAWITGAMSVLGSIVNSVGVTWVLARRNQAVKEELEAKEELMGTCGRGNQNEVAKSIENELAHEESLRADAGFNTSAIEAYEKKLKLLGSIR